MRTVPHIPIPTKVPATPQPLATQSVPLPTATSGTYQEARTLLEAGTSALSTAKGAAFQIDATLQTGTKDFSINYWGDFDVTHYVSAEAAVASSDGSTFEGRIISGFHNFYLLNAITQEWESHDYRNAPFVTNIGALFGWRWQELTGLSLGDRGMIEGVESQAISARLNSIEFSAHHGDFEATLWFGVKDNLLRKVSLAGEIQLDQEFSIVGVEAPPGAQMSLELTARIFDHGKSVPVLTPNLYFPVYSGHNGILLEDGRVLVGGGVTGFVANNNLIIPSPTGPVQIYDPSTALWTLIEPIEGPGLLYSVVELANKRILMVGIGTDEEGEVASMASLFDFASDSWTAVAPPLALRAQPNLLRLRDGRVLMTGGWAVTDADTMFFSNTELLKASKIFDPASGIWTEAAEMHELIEGADFFLLNDGRVLVIGATGERVRGMPHAEVYDPAVDRWTILDSLDPHYSPTEAVLLSDGRLLVIGGLTSYDDFIYNEDENGDLLSIELPDGRRFTTEDEFGKQFFGAKIYDPAADTWATTGLMKYPRVGATLTLLPEGSVLAAGGMDAEAALFGDEGDWPAPTEIFDPATGIWSLGPELTEPRVAHSATVLPDGRVLIAGGIGLTRTNNPEIYPLTSSEIIDPSP